MIIENPWNINGQSYLQLNFIKPSLIDRDRSKRGDYMKKPTAYWFINCEPTYGHTYTPNKHPQIVMQKKCAKSAGVCSVERSMISPLYAHNFICDFILGEPTSTQLQLKLF